MSKPFKPGEMIIEKINLSNFTRSTDKNLNEVVLEFSYYESLFSPTISASVILNDASGLLNGFPIIGDEDLELSFRNSTNDDAIDVKLRSYKVGARTRTAERAVVYPVFFASQRAVRNPKTEVLSFYEGKISDFIKTFPNFVEVEETEGSYRYVPTGETFFDTVKILGREAKSLQHRSSSYIFYELSDGYRFITLESLFNKPTAKKYYYLIGNVDREIPQDVIISKLEQVKSADLVEGMESGLYGNTTSAIDPLRKVFNSKTFNYFSRRSNDGFNATKHIPQAPSLLQSRRSSFAFGSETAHEKYFVSDLNDVAGIPYIKEYDPEAETFVRHRHQFAGVETSLRSQAKSIKYQISVPGDSSRHAGDIIEILFPEPDATKSSLYQYDKYLAGRFLVTGVQHLYQTNKEYVTVMECVKDSLEEIVSNNLEIEQGIGED